jgi:hypothetical protein
MGDYDAVCFRSSISCNGRSAIVSVLRRRFGLDDDDLED